MNLIVDTILRRRSVREGFGGAPIPIDILEDVVRCGLAAPSSKNACPWRFHVVTDHLIREELAVMVESAEGINSYVPSDPATGKPRPEYSSTVFLSASVLRNTPVAIFIENSGAFSRGRQALLQATPEALAGAIVGYTLEIIGVGAAVENMWIAAVGHGLAGVFMGDILIAEQAIKQRLSIECDLVGVLALGYAETREAQTMRDRVALGAEQVRWLVPGG